MLGESGEDQICGQGISGGGMGGPIRLVTNLLIYCLNFVTMLFSVVLMIGPGCALGVLFPKAILSTPGVGDFASGFHAG